MSQEVCKVCGLPKEFCVCSDIVREAQSTIKVYVEKRKWGREVTVISGIDPQLDLEKLAKKLKKKLAAGGTAKDGKIELQGNHKFAVKDLLIQEGFAEENIEIQ